MTRIIVVLLVVVSCVYAGMQAVASLTNMVDNHHSQLEDI